MFRRLFSGLVVTAIIFASVLHVCTKMIAMVELGGGAQLAPMAVMAGCLSRVKGCFVPTVDHMRSFADANPFTLSTELLLLLLSVAVAFVRVSFFSSFAAHVQLARQRWRVRFRERARIFFPLPLSDALRRGILNSRYYA